MLRGQVAHRLATIMQSVATHLPSASRTTAATLTSAQRIANAHQILNRLGGGWSCVIGQTLST